MPTFRRDDDAPMLQRPDRFPAPTWLSGRFQVLVLAALAAVTVIITAPMLVEEVYPDELTVIQAPFTGSLAWYTTPGWKYQGFGTVTSYKKRYTVGFKEGPLDATKRQTGGLSIRFSDGGHATMYGSVQFKMPESEKSLNVIHASYRGSDAVVENLLKTVLNKSVYLTGTLMTSKESYAEKKNDLLHYVTDQMQNGVYRTRQTTKWVKDEITNQSKEITLAEILLDKDGNIPAPGRLGPKPVRHHGV